MMRRMLGKAEKYKAVLCIIVAVFFFIFVVILHVLESMPTNMLLTDDKVGNHETRQGSRMDGYQVYEQQIIEDLVVNVGKGLASQRYMQSFMRGHTNVTVLRFLFWWFLAVGLQAGFLRKLYYCLRRNLLLWRNYLFVVVTYIHNSDGKKAICL